MKELVLNEHHCEVPDEFVEPMREGGNVPTVGWDIPTYWAIDSVGKCYLNDGGHGGPLEEVTTVTLLRCLYFEDLTGNHEAKARVVLNLKPRLPNWVLEAQQAGWTPPIGWDESQYDNTKYLFFTFPK